ncbi:MAG: cyclic nucleotide-binding domain-containing protein [Desulfamplus sp.]|nr:cyclic nucleotide-binding domain-containing protein [Desulfamplus sp.]
MDNLINQEALVEKYIAENNTEKAVKLLFDLSVHYANNKNFSKAEALRNRLIEVDSMALTEIITSAEIIEEERSAFVDKDYLKLWETLYSTLNVEETNALYYARYENIYLPDQTIFRQGELNSNLYFINRGEVKIVYLQNDKETLLKILKPGDIAGSDSFFSISTCTTSMISLTGSQIDTISRDTFKNWETSFPSIASKIKDFCLKTQTSEIFDLLKEKGLERRVHQRTEISGYVMATLVRANNEPVGKPFKGSLSDISAGGVSFYIKTSKKETVRLLLGRTIAIKFILPEDQQQIVKKATVVSVGYHLFNDYSVHADFEKKISSEMLLNIIDIMAKNQAMEDL